VAAWQQALNDWQYPKTLRVDGIFGPRTLVVTEAYQRKNRIHVTGTVGLADWMNWLAGALTALGPAGGTFRTAGVFDANIGWWQITLNRWLSQHHRPQLVIDCTLGPRTTAAVLLFQRTLKLPTTGLLDPRTWKVAERLNLTYFP
jgi:peptidoglycan hydrolase-like protein with peptidoglycan-binding domain